MLSSTIVQICSAFRHGVEYLHPKKIKMKKRNVFTFNTNSNSIKYDLKYILVIKHNTNLLEDHFPTLRNIFSKMYNQSLVDNYCLTIYLYVYTVRRHLRCYYLTKDIRSSTFLNIINDSYI